MTGKKAQRTYLNSVWYFRKSYRKNIYKLCQQSVPTHIQLYIYHLQTLCPPIGIIWVKHHSIFHPAEYVIYLTGGLCFTLKSFVVLHLWNGNRKAGETSALLLMGITNVSVIPLHLKLPSPSAHSQITAKEWSWDSLPCRALVFSPAKRLRKIHPVDLHHGGQQSVQQPTDSLERCESDFFFSFRFIALN